MPAARPTPKFRPPRLRRDVVARSALLTRAEAGALDARLLLVQAPAGFGKTTLLAQLAERLAAAQPRGHHIAWLTVDADDNDANRLLAAVLAALRPWPLEWPVEPEAVLSQVQGDGAAARAALVPVLNALASYGGERAWLFIDDLHRVTDAGALALLDALLERLPPEIGLVVGSRTEPALALARRRARGELAELLAADLQFDAEAARAMLAARGVEALPAEGLQAVLARTGGWAAGLQLLAGAHAGRGAALTPLPAGALGAGTAAQRHLFEFFASEVLAELPDDLRQFVLRCAVLDELTPAACAAVAGRADTPAVLDALYRRHLFLTALDDTSPAPAALRFHDLFLDFLRSELDRRAPGLAATLHARAAAAVDTPERAVHHWLRAGRWDDALAAMHRAAPALLAAGGRALVERWLAQLPDELRASHAAALHLQGLCAWSAWDWPGARDRFRPAVEAYRAAGDEEHAVEVLSMLGACHNGMGELAESTAALAQARGWPLPPALQVPFDSLRAWVGLATGALDEITPAIAAMAQNVRRAPATRFPNVADMGYGHLVGLPGTAGPLRELIALGQPQPGDARELRMPALAAWLAFWHGEPSPFKPLLHELQHLQRQAPGKRVLVTSAQHLTALQQAAAGEPALAKAAAQAAVEAFDAPEAAGQRPGWLRSHQHVLARVHWIAQDAAGLAALLPRLRPAHGPQEWPVLDVAALLVQGQAALLAGQAERALPLLRGAAERHRTHRLPVFFGDPRLPLAFALQQSGDEAGALAAFDAALADAAAEDALGPLLMEPRARVERLWAAWAAAPAPECAADGASAGLSARARAAAERLHARWLAWAPSAVQPPAVDRGLASLSDREREVLALLADGQSNKLIARAMSISPHTVKRHVANLLDKLGVQTRTQAAARWLQPRR
ncbi:LuxR C-terminal-related transcriptional regulator [Aquincola sp. MAHUQ-54]|uniref:LuxR C-terminal-related transcriptional regulator n=1 Tax=Aquincola agrisoli TaxID=3119538 RepID=A0AAW9QKE2_9BURK